ncbi:MAG: cytochrome c biogenesis protein CcsA [Planctomycetes bacterium]|nr:cytochrome c biogenesis protein CcsA [Planctomycetota bacterium]
MIDRISLTCFGASYAVALGLDCLYIRWPVRFNRIASLGFTIAGLCAQTAYLAYRQPPLVEAFGYLLFLAWVLAIIHLVRVAPHHGRSISLFTLPLVMILVLLAWMLGGPAGSSAHFLSRHNPLVNSIHVGSLAGAGITLSLGFLGSCMYLARSWQLRSKHVPGWGLRLPSLETLETAIRWSIAFTFPLMTAGLVLGVGLGAIGPVEWEGWTNSRVIATFILWIDFAVLLGLRHGLGVRGNFLSVLVIVAFGLFILCAVLPHPTTPKFSDASLVP